MKARKSTAFFNGLNRESYVPKWRPCHHEFRRNTALPMLEPGEAPCLKAQMCISSFHDQNPEFLDEIASVMANYSFFMVKHVYIIYVYIYMFFMIK